MIRLLVSFWLTVLLAMSAYSLHEVSAHAFSTQNIHALPRASIWVGDREFRVPVADTAARRAAGLRGSVAPFLLFVWPHRVRPVFNMLGCDHVLWRYDFDRADRLGAPVVMQPGRTLYPVYHATRCVLEINPAAPAARFLSTKSFSRSVASLKLPAFCS
jgi:hypothetical protein